MLADIIKIGVPTLMIEMPAAWHLSKLALRLGPELENHVKFMRKSYFNEVVAPSIDFLEYVDLMDHISANSNIIKENSDNSPPYENESPRHIKQQAIDCIGENFLDFCHKKYDKNKMLERLMEMGEKS
jgi:hypothetical protein